MERVYSDLRSEDPFKLAIPRRVLIIGGGPAGLVTLRNFQERGTFDTVQLVERRDDVGGVWSVDAYFHPRTEANDSPQVPRQRFR